IPDLAALAAIGSDFGVRSGAAGPSLHPAATRTRIARPNRPGIEPRWSFIRPPTRVEMCAGRRLGRILTAMLTAARGRPDLAIWLLWVPWRAMGNKSVRRETDTVN